MIEILAQKAWILLLILLAFYAFYKYQRRKRTPVTWTISYAHYVEPAVAATPDFEKVFEGMIPQDRDGVTLLRVSLMNRGEATAEPEDFLSPITISLPEDSRILDAMAAESFGGVNVKDVSVSSRLNTLTVNPFRFTYRTTVIFNIVIDGPAEPIAVDGALKGQDRLRPLE